jgi:hypothetical protein
MLIFFENSKFKKLHMQQEDDYSTGLAKMNNLVTDPRALRVIKRPINIKVTFAKADGICQTLEGPVNYLTGDAILTGIANENWPVMRAMFDKRYEPAEGTAFGSDGNYVKKPLEVLALRLEMPLNISLPAGGVLHGETGDWLLQYGPADYGIVRDDIFRRTYDFL